MKTVYRVYVNGICLMETGYFTKAIASINTYKAKYSFKHLSIDITSTGTETTKELSEAVAKLFKCQ